LDLFDNHLRGAERETAVRRFVAYIRVFHAMLDLGLIKESELLSMSRRAAEERAERDGLARTIPA
jgi:hypothetical protein